MSKFSKLKQKHGNRKAKKEKASKQPVKNGNQFEFSKSREFTQNDIDNITARIEQDPNGVILYILRAKAYIDVANNLIEKEESDILLDKAVKDCEMSLKHDDLQIVGFAPYYMMSVALEKKGDQDKYIEVMQYLADHIKDSTHTEYHWLGKANKTIGDKYFQQGKYSEAVKLYLLARDCYEAAWKIDNNDNSIKYLIQDYKENIEPLILEKYKNIKIEVDIKEDLQRESEIENAKLKLLSCNGYKGKSAENIKEAFLVCDKYYPPRPEEMSFFSDAFYAMGLCKDDNEDFYTALALYTIASEINPNDVMTLNDRGHTYYKLSKYKNALSDYTAVLEKHKEISAIWFNRAKVYGEMSKAVKSNDLRLKADLIGKTISDLTKAIELEPDIQFYFLNRATYTCLLADIYEQQGNKNKAIGCYERAWKDLAWGIALSDDKSSISTIKSHFLGLIPDKNLLLRLEQEADKNKDILEQRASKIKEISNNYREFIENRSNVESLIKAFNICEDLLPEDIEKKLFSSVYKEAFVKFIKQDNGSVLQQYYIDKAIEYYPDNQDLYIYNTLYFENHLNIIEILDKGIENCKENYLIYQNRAMVYASINETEKALADYEILISLNPKIGYIDRGNFYKNELADFDKAMEDFNKAIELFPNVGSFYSSRAGLYEIKNMKEEALSDYSRAINLSPAIDRFYQDRAEYYKRLKLYDEAIKDYTIAIKLSVLPNKSTYNYNRRSKLYEIKGDIEKTAQNDDLAMSYYKLAWLDLHNCVMLRDISDNYMVKKLLSEFEGKHSKEIVNKWKEEWLKDNKHNATVQSYSNNDDIHLVQNNNKKTDYKIPDVLEYNKNVFEFPNLFKIQRSVGVRAGKILCEKYGEVVFDEWIENSFDFTKTSYAEEYISIIEKLKQEDLSLKS